MIRESVHPVRLALVVALAGTMLLAVTVPGNAWGKSKRSTGVTSVATAGGLSESVALAETELSMLRAKYLKPKVPRTAEDVQRRINDGEVFYVLKDYVRASIIFFEIVEDPKLTSHPGYKDSVFFLADSLYHNKNYKTAREFFEKVLAAGYEKYRQNAILRLIEIALITEDHDAIDTYWARLSSVPADKIKTELRYVYGKALHKRGMLELAAREFSIIPKGDYWYLPARYFLGAIAVAQGRTAEEAILAAAPDDLEKASKEKAKHLDRALGFFEEAAAVEPEDARHKRIVELTFISQGRVLYELGRAREAIEAYQEVSRKSDEFDTALYEVTWAFIQMREYENAVRALDILALAAPDSLLVPEVTLLRGNLLLRLGRFPKATAEFEEVIKRFQPVREAMEATLRAHPDPIKYFAAKVRSLTDFDFKVFLPPLAQRWAAADADVSKALEIASDMVLTKKNIEESEDLVDLLEDALDAKSRVDIFIDLSEGAGRGYGLGQQIVLLKRGLLDMAIREGAKPSDPSRYAALESERRKLEALWLKVPRDVKSFREREKGVLAKFAELEKEAFLLSFRIDGMKARLVALETYTRDMRERGDVDEEKAASDKDRLDGELALILDAEDALAEMRKTVVREKARIGLGDEATVADAALRSRLSELLTAQASVLFAGAGLAGGAGSRLAALMARLTSLESGLQEFEVQLEEYVVARTEGLWSKVREEKAKLIVYRGDLGGIDTDVTGLAGELAYKSFVSVKGKFYDLVLRADVGFLDVAWAMKEERSDAVSKLISAKSRDLRVLDSEFEEVLEDVE